MPDIDNLNIKISASSREASGSIDKLVEKLGKLNMALGNYASDSKYISGIRNLADGFKSISTAVNEIDVDKIGSLAKNLSSITSQLNRMDKISGKLGFGDITKSANVMGESVKKVADDLAKTWGITNKEAIADLETKFDDYIDTAVSGSNKVNESFKRLADTIRDNARIADDSKAVYADLLKYVEKTNSAFLSGKGSSITLGFTPSEFTDDYTSMRATAGAAFTSQVGVGNGDFENYINELNSALGNIIPIGNTAAETFSNFVRILKDARNNTVSFSEAVQNGFVGLDSVDEDIVEFSNDIYKLERAARQAGEQVTQSSYSFQNIAESLNSLGSINIPDSTNLATFVSALQGLGTAKIEKAAANLPALGEGLKKLFTTLKDAPTVNSSIIQMTNSLANLASQGGRVGTASNTLTGGLDRSSKSMDRARKSSKSLAAAFGKFYATYFLVIRGVKKLWSSIENSMSYIETLNYFNAAFDQITEKADLSAFEKLGYKSAEEYAKSFSDRAKELTAKMTGFNINDNGTLTATGAASLGLNPDKLMNYQAMFGQMASSMGVASDNAVILSNVLTEIGADLASVKNLEFEDVWEDMASGLTGMSRTLDKYGVNIRNVNLQQKLTDLGIQANIANLNQQDKALLRTIVLLDSTRYAWADLADTIDQPANQLRLLQANFQNLSRTIGSLFLPIVQKVLPYINGLVIAVQRLAQWLVSLLGIDLNGVSSAIGGTDLSKFSDSLDEATGAMGAASKAADKLKKGIRGFDELNVITTKDDTDSGSGAGVGVGGLLDDAFLDAVSEYQKAWDEAFANLQNKAEQIADRISKVFEPVKKLFEDIKIGDWFAVGQDVSGIVSGIFNFFADAIASVDWYAIGHNIGEFILGLDWVKILDSVGRVIWEGINAAFDLYKGLFDAAPLETALVTAIAAIKIADIIKKVWAAKKIEIALDIAPFLSFSVNPGMIGEIGIWIERLLEGTFLDTKTWTGIPKKIDEFFDWLIMDVIGGAMDKVGLAIWDFVSTVFEKLFNFDLTKFHFNAAGEWFSKIKEDFAAQNWLGIGEDILKGIGEGILGALTFLVEPIMDLFDWTWKTICGVFGIHSPAEEMKPIGKNIILGIVEGFKGAVEAFNKAISEWFNNNVAPWFTKEKWSQLGENARDSLSRKWEEIKTNTSQTWNNIKTDISGKWENIKTSVSNGVGNVKTDISGAWENIKNTTSNIWGSITDTVSSAAKTIAEKASSIFDKIGQAKDKIADFFSSAKSLDGISISAAVGVASSLPKSITGFASGGFIENPHSYSLFMAGENGIPEMLGTVGGQPAVAGGQEITGISDTIRSETERQNELLRQQNELLQALLEKDTGISGSDLFNSVRKTAYMEYKRTGDNQLVF